MRVPETNKRVVYLSEIRDSVRVLETNKHVVDQSEMQRSSTGA